ncbi:helix-turn-helix domain-containing protein [Deinococcus sp. VB343]|uniref:helix-turn-helix domain-containing protein n=1 Tax=Deinococcus sp. VB343 TaxID=3385567 RepID=UPI0039C92A3B
MDREQNPKSVKVSAMNDAVRAAINARLHEKKMSRADLARATGLRPQAVTRALNGAEGGGTVPPAWAAILDALGMTLTAVPVEHAAGGPALTLPSDPQQLAQLAGQLDALAQQLREAAQPSTAPDSEPGSAGGDDSTP